jgi:hypothetical protein
MEDARIVYTVVNSGMSFGSKFKHHNNHIALRYILIFEETKGEDEDNEEALESHWMFRGHWMPNEKNKIQGIG